MNLRIVRNDITKMNTEAIVNPANSAPIYGPGCDAAIYKAAGEDELLAIREKIGYVNSGQAFITPGLALPAKMIIHAVSPRFLDGKSGEDELLRHCYRNACKVAVQNGIRSIAFPILGTGAFGYPKDEGMQIALEELSDCLKDKDIDVYLVVFDKESTELGRKIDPNLESYISNHYVAESADRYARGGTRQSLRVPDRAFTGAPVLASKKKSLLGGGIFRTVSKGSKASIPDAEPVESKGWRDASLDDEADAACFTVAGDVETVRKFDSEIICSSAAADPEAISSALSQRMEHMCDSFQQYLFFLIEKKGMSNSEVYKRGLIDKRLFAKIKADENYHPKKITAMQLCVGLMLNLDETKDLLARAGYALSPCDKTDVIFSFFIENGVYDMIEIDIQLEEHGLPCLIA